MEEREGKREVEKRGYSKGKSETEKTEKIIIIK